MPTERFENYVNFNPPPLLPANVDFYVGSSLQVTFITFGGDNKAKRRGNSFGFAG